MSQQDDLPDAVRRVEMAAMEKGLPIRIVKTATTARTAEEAATAVGATAAEIVKSLVFRGTTSGEAYLLLVSGANRVDETKLATLVGEPVVRPDAAFVREATGFAIGGVSPLGATHRLRIFADETLLTHAVVWAAAGTPFHVFEADPRRLIDMLGAETVSLS